MSVVITYLTLTPVTGQAAWFDVRVRVYKAEDDADNSLPQFESMKLLPGMSVRRKWLGYFAGKFDKKKGAK